MAIPGPDFFSFGTLLKGFRTRRRLTQQQLAEAIGVHRSAVNRWEQGNFLPKQKGIVLELARCLKLDDQETRQLLEASLTALAPYWSVPLPRNPYFTGREEILDVLHTHLSTNGVVALTQSYALQGLGGIGKTQLALEYTYRHALEYSAVFWIEAEAEETAISSLVHMADILQLSERKEADQQRVMEAVQRWLRSHNGWLLIWDNVENLDVLSRLLPATTWQGAILLTTHCQALGTRALGMDVTPMTQEEGMLFVLRRARLLSPDATETLVQQFAAQRSGEYAAARQLVALMGGLPLALDQAGAYMEETGCGLAVYLHAYQQQCLHLLDRRGKVRSDHPLSVVATLELACQRVVQQNPGALELLRFCAFLHPDAIPEELLLAGVDHLGPVLGPVVAHVSSFDEALATLRTFSLVQRQPETHTLSLHRLVQVILLGGMSKQDHTTLQRRMIHLLNTVFPEVTATVQVETWELRERLLPHVMSCVATIPEHLQDQEVAALLLKAGQYLSERGQWEQAEWPCQRAALLLEQTLGSEHPQVGSSLYVLATLCLAKGKYEQAEQLFQRTLRIQERTLGEAHPDVAFPLYSMGRIYYRQGQYGQAEVVCQRALRIQEQTLGEMHPDLSLSLNVLGSVYRDQGKYEQAESMFHRALRINEQVLGPEHPELARALNNLGMVYIDQKKYKQAEPLCQRAVALAEQGWGSEHDNVATMLDTLATLYGEMGQYEQAKPLHLRALQITERTRGPDHPFVALSLHGLALVSQGQGEYDEAESFYRRALHLREQQRGRNHPETAQTLHELALFQKNQGNVYEARSLALRALQIRAQTLGTAHPQTVASRMLLAEVGEASEISRDEVSGPSCKEEGSDHIKSEPLREKTELIPHEASNASLSEDDPLQEFLDSCCEFHPLAWCTIYDLWQTYEHWMATRRDEVPLPRRTFATQLKARGCRVGRTNAARIWRGIRLVNTRS